jgi:hypothetical protein
MRPGHHFQWVTEGRSIDYDADESGFRTGANDRGHGDQPHRMVILGDSFMWGTGVQFPETTGAILEALLGGWRVDNLAMPGFGVDQIWQSAVHRGLPLAPDLVVVGLFPADFERSFHAYRQVEGFGKSVFQIRNGELVQMTAGDNPGIIYRFVEAHSRLFRLWQVAERWSGRKVGLGGWWTRNEKILDAIIHDCAGEGVPVLFIHIPYAGGTEFPYLRTFMDERSTPLLEPFDLPDAEREKYYFREDGHLNPAGHRRQAALIEEWVRANLQDLGV